MSRSGRLGWPAIQADGAREYGKSCRYRSTGRISEEEAGICDLESGRYRNDHEAAVKAVVGARDELKRVKREVLPRAERDVREAEGDKARVQNSLQAAQKSLSENRSLVRDLQSQLEGLINGTPPEAPPAISSATRAMGLTVRPGPDPAEHREQFTNRLEACDAELPALLESRREARHKVAVLEQSILRARADGKDETSIRAELRTSQRECNEAERAYSAVFERAEALRDSISRLDQLAGAAR